MGMGSLDPRPSPDLSMLHAESVTLKNWEWPGYEARVWVLFRVRRFYSASCDVLASYPGLGIYEASNVQVQQCRERQLFVWVEWLHVTFQDIMLL